MKTSRMIAKGTLGAFVLMAHSAMAAPTSADGEVAALKQQLKALTERLSALEAQQQQQQPALASVEAPADNAYGLEASAAAELAPAAGKPKKQAAVAKSANPGEGKPVVGGSMPGSFKLPGSNTSVKFGGYAKLDAIQDVSGAHGARYANFATIPLDSNGASSQGSQFNMHARQSRLNMETRSPSDIGEIKTFLEVDFFGSASGNANTTNGEGLQLRQAYGQVGRVLAGQTWSNFMDMDAYPESLDYIGPAGLTFVRQAQVRYTDSINDKLGYSVAIESPNSDFTAAVNTDVSLNNVPDLTAKLQYKDSSMGQLSLRGLARQLRAGNNSTAGGVNDSDFGWGVGLSGKLNTIDKDAAFFQAVYGDGVGHYLFDVANSLNGSTYASNHINPQEAWGGYLGYQHYWAPSWRSNFLAGYTGIDNRTSITGTAVNKEIASGHVNLIYSPVASYRVGLEYMHGYREQESGVEGDLDRVQASFMYLF